MGSLKGLVLLLAIVVALQEPAEGGTVRSVTAAVKKYLLGTLRHGKSNVVIVVDAAGSFREQRRFGTIKHFTSALVESLPLTSGSKLSLITASSRGKTYHPLTSVDKGKVASAAKSMRFSSRKSLLGGIVRAIRLLRRSKTRGTRNVIIQISTGHDRRGYRHNLATLYRNVLRSNIEVFSFAFYRANRNQLRRITSTPLSHHLYSLRYYTNVASLTSRLRRLKPAPSPKPQPTLKSTQVPVVTTTAAPSPTPDNGKPMLDKCNRVCLYVGGQMKYCTRIRKDFTSMSSGERARWIAAYKKASTTQPYKRDYDRLIKMHKTLFRTTIHTRDKFLPWHRWYILQLENLLRRIDCRITMPYWDWSLWSHDPWNVNHVWKSSSDGLGGNGIAPSYCVREGLFSKSQWQVTPSARHNGQTCLKRRFNGNPPDTPAVIILLKTPIRKFITFEENLRVNFHDRVHCAFSNQFGHMCTLDASAAPEFFLHHGFVDKIWSDYQKISSEHKTAHFSRLTSKKMGGTNYTPSQVYNLRRQPEGVRVIYSDPTHDHARKILRTLEGMTVKALDGLPRSKFSPISRAAIKMFHIGNKELAMSKKFEKLIKPVNVVKKNALHGVNKQLGFIV